MYLASESLPERTIAVDTIHNKHAQLLISWESVSLSEKLQVDISEFPKLVKVDGLWSRLTSARGWEKSLLLAGKIDSLDDALAPYASDFYQDLLTSCSSVSAADIVVIADDIASTVGPLFDPTVAEHSLFRYYTQAPQEGSRAAFHSDGNIKGLLPAIYKSGFSHVHLAGINLQMFAYLAREAHASSLVPMGGFGSSTLADPNLLQTLQDLRATTGLLFADDAGLTSRQQLEQLLAIARRI